MKKLLHFKFVIILLASFLTHCQHEKNGLNQMDDRVKYDVEINYSDYSNRSKSEHINSLFAKDSLYLFVEVGFKNDLLSVYINGDQVIKDTISTEDQSGYAAHYTLGKLPNVKQLGVRINNGKLALMEISNMNLINLNFRDEKLILSVLDNVPFYD
ncbi:hypothetical protein [Chondrinema litorale]|uniref:hypothetical protein n=1 Tax=Chondrinema litorale TaxID=2994555 RepID=UPI0025432059|nr:hypothetical protein [Chondrinema litorale]UZR99493.1 hypothetical protein OQ292_36490 [Chondrinema litorale]